MSQLKEAFRVAGFLSPAERLRQIAIAAMSQHATSNDAAIAAVLHAVRHDLLLTWALFTPYDTLAVKKLFADVRHELRQDEKARERGQAVHENHQMPAPFARQGGGHSQREDHGPFAPSRAITLEQRAAKARTAAVIRVSLLDTFQIDGTPIGDWQAGAARTWARTTGRHVRWVEMLTANMPPADPIRRWMTPDEAQSLWQRAAREGDA